MNKIWLSISITFESLHYDAYWGIKYFFLISSKAKETHRSWLAGRNWQVVVAELLPVTWPQTSHLIGSNQIFNHDHDRSFSNDLRLTSNTEHEWCCYMSIFIWLTDRGRDGQWWSAVSRHRVVLYLLLVVVTGCITEWIYEETYMFV